VTMAQATGQGQTPVRRRLPWILLALSLALNLFFIGGALWIRMHLPPPGGIEARFHRMPAELGLDPQQKTAFEGYARQVRNRIGELHGATNPVMTRIWAEMARPDADEGKLTKLFDQVGADRHAFQRDLMRSTLAFLATLSPEQRAKFVAIMQRRPKGWGHRPPPEASR
jgi:Spy/CpxP family protein refolding chaperone